MSITTFLSLLLTIYLKKKYILVKKYFSANDFPQGHNSGLLYSMIDVYGRVISFQVFSELLIKLFVVSIHVFFFFVLLFFLDLTIYACKLHSAFGDVHQVLSV